MLELLGTIGSNVLSLPGILGFGIGMMTRNAVVAAILGGLVGFGEAVAFAGFSFSGLSGTETAASVGIGVVAGLLGSALRRKGTTV